MARSDFVLNIGDDNVVLTRLVDRKVVNAWLASPDPAMATEELGEALASDKKATVSVLIDTLDQAFKEEELPKVNVLDRRKLVARHINMAFPGANLRGARLIGPGPKKTLVYQFASVPLDGRIPGWLDFVASLPNPKGGIHAIAAENADLLAALAPKDAPVEEGKNHWRHLIGINVSGGLRQIIEKNGRLSLTRLTQAPPPETPPDEFADLIARDFKATITYIRRLGYVVGDALDLIVLTTVENKAALDGLNWDGARSVSIYTPFEAALAADLGPIGREDQAYCDVLHAAWFAHKRRPALPLTRSAALGDMKDDVRELAYAAAPYAAVFAIAGVIGWLGWAGVDTYNTVQDNRLLESQVATLQANVAKAQQELRVLPYDAAKMRNVLQVNEALETGRVDFMEPLRSIAAALESDAVVLSLQGRRSGSSDPRMAQQGGNAKEAYVLRVNMRLASVITRAEEAVQTARRLEGRLNTQLGKSFSVKMVKEPVAAQSATALSGGLFTAEAADNTDQGRDEQFFVEFEIAKAAS
jgi:hypothetical protein